MKMPDYTNRELCDGDGRAPLSVGTRVLTSNGFQVALKSGSSLRFTGPGTIRSRKNPILGASEVRIAMEQGHLVMEARFGSIQKMMRTLSVVLVALAVAFVVGFGIWFREGGIPLFFRNSPGSAGALDRGDSVDLKTHETADPPGLGFALLQHADLGLRALHREYHRPESQVGI